MNRTVTGSGDFLVSTSGAPTSFGDDPDAVDIDGDGENDFVLLPGQKEKWFRFTTLGDGKAGDQIRLITPAGETRTVLVRGVDGRLVPTPPSGNFQVETGPVINIGAQAGDAAILELDLSAYLDRIDRLNTITKATLKVDYERPTLPAPSPTPGLLDINGTVFFAADGGQGVELWKTDGTVLGTSLVKDINGGVDFPGHTRRSSNPSNFVNFNGTLFFTATTAANGTELFRSDGTAAGTVLVSDLLAGPSGASPSQLTVVGNTLFFATTTANGTELFKSDGTAAGTVPVADLVAGAGSSNPSQLTVVGNTLFFTAATTANGAELFKSDGTAAGTVLVRDIRAGASGSNPANLVNANGTLFFRADDGLSGAELWKSNGTLAGTVPVADIFPGSGRSFPTGLVAFGSRIFFRAQASAAAGFELFTSDGTTTTQLGEINPTGASTPLDLTLFGNQLIFTANDGISGRELYRVSAASPAAPTLLKNIAPGNFVGSDPSDFKVVGNTLFFTADSGDRVRELWKTDGTANGTVPVAPSVANPDNLAASDSKLFFTAPGPDGANRLLISDGTAAGTKLLAEAGLLNRVLVATALNEEGDGAVTAGDGSVAATLISSVNLNAVNGTRPIELDVTQLVRDTLAAGKTRFAIRLGLNSPSLVPLSLLSMIPNPVFGATVSNTGLEITTARQEGVLADLYGANGEVLQQGVPVVDLRAAASGSYLVRIYNPFSADQTEPLPFVLQVNAPLPAFSQPYSDRDVVRAGDGNDIVIGNNHLDFLFGERGDDAFLAQTVEVRDREAGEWVGAPADAEKIQASQGDLKPLDPQVRFGEEKLKVAVARALGLPVTTKFDFSDLVRDPITASRMATLLDLDLGAFDLRDITGLEFAVNLSTLNLANNRVLDLSPLAPGTATEGDAVGSPIGLSRLEHLALDFNGLASIAPLTGILGLKALSLDGNPIVELTPISRWNAQLPEGQAPALTFLSLDRTGIGPQAGSGLVGEYYTIGTELLTIPDLRHRTVTHRRVDAQVNFAPGTADFGGFADLDDNFAVRWTGQLLVPADADYSFFLKSDEGTRLYVDGKLVVDNDGLPIFSNEKGGPLNAQGQLGTITLTAGAHDLQLEFFDRLGSAGAELSFQINGGAKQVIPTGVLRPRGAADLSPLAGLENLRFLSASHNALEDVGPLAGLNTLEIVNLDDNNIGAIGPLAGKQLIDDGGAGYSELGAWQHTRRPVTGAFGEDYAFHAGSNGASSDKAIWNFAGLPAGRYQVLVTWPAHDTRASNAPFQVFESGASVPLLPEGSPIGTVLVNQHLAPAGAVHGGRPWHSLGVFEIGGNGLRVEQGVTLADGSVAADAVRIVALGPVLESIERLDIGHNPLDNDAYQLYVPELQARDTADPTFTFTFDPNAAGPQWVTRLGPQGSRGETIDLIIDGFATDAQSVTYTAESLTAGVTAGVFTTQVAGSPPVTHLSLAPSAGFAGSARIRLVAHDDDAGPGQPQGRTAEQTFDFNVDAGVIYGQKFHDLDQDGVKDGNEPGLEGWKVFLDTNANRIADVGEATALTDANGDYGFTGLTPFRTYTVAETLLGNNWIQRAPFGKQETFLVSDLNPGLAPSTPLSEFAEFNGDLYFRATRADVGSELWRFDGSRITLAADIQPGAQGSQPFDFAVFAGALYFAADGGDGAGLELWKFDGTTARRVTDLNPGAASSTPVALAVFNNQLFFAATQTTPVNLGRELFKFDGTNVALADDIVPGAGSSSPTDLIVFKGNLYFAANSPASVRELWKFNGVDSFIIPEADAATTVNGPIEPILFDNQLYFRANGTSSTNNLGVELWRTDGNTISLAANIAAASGVSGFPAGFAVFNNALYFAADGNDGFGTELWRFNGTTATRITDLQPGSSSSGPDNPAVFDNKLFFAAASSATGRELFQYDGNVATLAADILAGTGGSSPVGLVPFKGNLLFSADASSFANGVSKGPGRELWRFGPQQQAGAHTVYVDSGQGRQVDNLDFGNFRVADAGPDKTVAEGSPVTLQGAAFAPNPAVGRNFGFAWSVVDLSDDAVVATGNQQSITFTPAQDGVFSATLTVTDFADRSKTYIDTALVFVNNVPPVFEIGADDGVAKGQVFRRTIAFTDPGADQWTATIDWDDGTVVERSLIERSLTLNHLYADQGVFTVRVTLRDDDDVEATDQFTMTVSAPPPQGLADAYDILEDQTVQLDVTANDTDVNDDALVASIAAAPGHGSASPNQDGTVTYIPDADFNGSDSFRYVAVNDAGAQSEELIVSINVTAVNDAPGFVPGADIIVNEDWGAQTFSDCITDLSSGPADESAQALELTLSNDNPDLFAVQPMLGRDGRLTFTSAPDAFGEAHVTVALTDDGGNANGGHDETTHVLTIAVTNVNDPPRLAAVDNVGVQGTDTLQLDLDATDADAGEKLTFSLIAGPDTTSVDPTTGLLRWRAPDVSVTTPVQITVRVADGAGGQDEVAFVCTVSPKLLTLTSFTPTASGFHAGFNRAFDPGVLDLYGTETGGQGPADVALVGNTVGAVRGSLVLDQDNTGFTFIKTGGTLDPDSYSADFFGRANGLRDSLGRALDGDDDGAAGGDAHRRFTVSAPAPGTVVVSIPDFSRGPGQSVKIPANAAGLPVNLSDGAGVESVSFTLTWDPSLLEVTGALAGRGVTSGDVVTFSPADTPGTATVTIAINAADPLAAGAVRNFISIQARVPQAATARYGANQVIDLSDVVINDGAVSAVGDDAQHVLSYLGDTNGDGASTTLDVQRIVRVLFKLDTGFARFPLIDPVVIADVNNNGSLTIFDAYRLLRMTPGETGTPEIPPIPSDIQALGSLPAQASAPTAGRSSLVSPTLPAAGVERVTRQALPVAGVPVIDMQAQFQNVSRADRPFGSTAAAASHWRKDFVNNLGHSHQERNPNSTIRLTVPASCRLTQK